jgi:predicted Zn-dependent protease
LTPVGLGRQLLAASPTSADLHVSLGHALKAVGRQKEATESYQMAAAAKPSFGDAWWSLANLKTRRFSQDEIKRMRAEESVPAARPVDRYHLCFALGKAFEDRNELCGIMAILRAWQCAQARREPLPSGRH